MGDVYTADVYTADIRPPIHFYGLTAPYGSGTMQHTCGTVPLRSPGKDWTCPIFSCIMAPRPYIAMERGGGERRSPPPPPLPALPPARRATVPRAHSSVHVA
ncbi:hypothetical protein GDO81_030093 [Engystomops pustulosus]|uniref:Uncharacterized protein n=1 Tax=Engystomops pustulosus TaxID=76066 RepID=A0AAV6YLH6_ENGPU|nr:hypothetical protein GDO81_030093 [Engystomops pustulosus]